MFDVEGTVCSLVEGSLNALPCLSLFTFVFISIFPAWPTRACGFSLSYSGFFVFLFILETSFSSVFTVFGGWIGNLCKSRRIFCNFRRSSSCWRGISCVFLLFCDRRDLGTKQIDEFVFFFCFFFHRNAVLVSLFNDISTLVGYLMTNLSL